MPWCSDAGGPGWRAAARKVVKGTTGAGNRCPMRCRVEARSPAADAPRVVGRCLGGPAMMLQASDEELEAAETSFGK